MEQRLILGILYTETRNIALYMKNTLMCLYLSYGEKGLHQRWDKSFVAV